MSNPMTNVVQYVRFH